MAMKKVASTKACRFEEGEKVLCYEPDPAKTKVLYNSKILKLVPEKDSQGRKFYQFLIHFRGWNPTWDRYVTDEFVLKDTEENRRLQRKLADEAQLTPGGHLYRRERKGRRVRSDPKPTSTELPENSVNEPVEEDNIPVPNDVILLPKRRLPELDFTDYLKYQMSTSFYLIQDKNLLAKLPCYPNVVTLLENYLKYYVRTHCSDTKTPKKGRKREIFDKTQIENRYNICIEILDGLRCCFNTYFFRKLLINENEQLQYFEAIAMPLEPPKPCINIPPQNGNQPEIQDNVPNGEEVEDHAHGKPEYAQTIESQSCSDCSLTKSQCSKLVQDTFYKVRDEHVSKADLWKAVPDSLYYEEVKEPSIVYGAYHLLRLLEKLPKILSKTSVNNEKLSAIYSVSNDLLSYLSNQIKLFGTDYFMGTVTKEKESNEPVKQTEEPVKIKRSRRH